MTLDGWSEVVRRLSTFTVLNLLIAVMVNTIGGPDSSGDSNVILDGRSFRAGVPTASIRSELQDLNRKLDLILAQNKQQQVQDQYSEKPELR